MTSKTKLVFLQVLGSIFQWVAVISMLWAGYLVTVGIQPNEPWMPFFVAMAICFVAALIVGALNVLRNKVAKEADVEPEEWL